MEELLLVLCQAPAVAVLLVPLEDPSVALVGGLPDEVTFLLPQVVCAAVNLFYGFEQVVETDMVLRGYKTGLDVQY